MAPTLNDRITSSLRERILTGDLAPGSRVVVDELRAAYKASHIPIREALRRLEAEGLIVHVANHGTHVAPLSRSEADDLYDARLIVEPHLALRALTQRSAEDVEAATLARKQMLAVDPVKEPVQFQHKHNLFHASLLAPGATPTLRRMMEQLWNNAERYMLFVYAHPNVPPVGYADHDMLFQLWLKSDERFVEVLVEHLNSARTELAETLVAVPLDEE